MEGGMAFLKEQVFLACQTLLHLQNKWLLKSVYCKLHLTMGLHIRRMHSRAATAAQLCMTHRLSELSPLEKGLRMRAGKPQRKKIETVFAHSSK